jgi:hypothetical protein
LPVHEPEEPETFPVTLPVNAAVIVPAVKLPEASLATIADAVLALVAFDVTVKVTAPELLNVVEPDNPVPEVAKVSVFASDPENEEAVQTPVALIVVAFRNAVVETPVEFTFPANPPTAVIVPALKLPDASLATIADAVLALVALLVTVKVAAPELLNVVDPERPVPETPIVRVFASDPENEEAVQTPVALSVVALRNAAVETPVAFMFPANPPTAVIVPALKLPDASLATIADAVLALVAVVALLDTLPAVAMVANFVSAIAAEALMSASTITPAAIAVALPTDVTSPVRFALVVTVAALPVHEPEDPLTLPVTLPVSAAVIVPALKLPDASLATIADAVLALVAFDVTVKVAAPELLKVVEPDNPVPEVFRVRVFASDPENDDAVTIPVALTVVALRNPTVETPVEFMLPVYPPLAVILVKVAVVPLSVGIVAAAPTFTVVA